MPQKLKPHCASRASAFRWRAWRRFFIPKPDSPKGRFLQCAQVGLWLKEKLEELKLESFPKTSGSKGLQVYVPLNTATTYDVTKPFARTLGERLEREHPELILSKMEKTTGKGRRKPLVRGIVFLGLLCVGAPPGYLLPLRLELP